MPSRQLRPRRPRNPTPPSLRLYTRMVHALHELDEWRELLGERSMPSALQSTALLETLDLCRRAVARETPPHWRRLLPRDRPPGVAELRAVVGDAIERLAGAKAAAERRARAAGLLD